MTSSLLGRSQEHKFQPVKIEQKSSLIKTDQPDLISVQIPIIGQPRFPFCFANEASMTPLLNRVDFELQYLGDEPQDFEEFKQKLERNNEVAVNLHRNKFKELNRFLIFEDALQILAGDRDLPEDEKKEVAIILNAKIRKHNVRQRNHSIGKYHNKKQKRKSPAYIRYKIRQDLAGTRVRNKGKFVRNQRPDLKKLADEYMRGDLKRTTTLDKRFWQIEYLLNFNFRAMVTKKK